MGYGNLEQQGTGLHTRLWSRGFIINDGENRIAFVSVDAGMMGDGIRIEVNLLNFLSLVVTSILHV